MSNTQKGVPVFLPKSMQQLLQYRKRYPQSVLHAGGTYLNRNQGRGDFIYPDGIIFLQHIPELEKISRTERYIEIGACATLTQMLDIGQSILPASLITALTQIGTRRIRNSATLGGNLSVQQRRMDLFPVLSLMNVRVELRKIGGSRWVQLSRLFGEDNTSGFQPGEVMTRVRIPFDQWEVQIFRKVGSNQIYAALDNPVFCGLGKVQKGLIQDVRFCFTGVKHLYFRDKSIESELAGKKLPVQEKIRETTAMNLEKKIQQSEVQLSDVHRIHMQELFSGFLDALSQEY